MNDEQDIKYMLLNTCDFPVAISECFLRCAWRLDHAARATTSGSSLDCIM